MGSTTVIETKKWKKTSS